TVEVEVPDLDAERAMAPARIEPRPSASSAQRVVGVSLGVLGVAALAVGTGFAIDASSKWTHVLDACKDATCPDAPTYAAMNPRKEAAERSAVVSTVALAGGGVALVAGAVLYLTAPSAIAGGRSGTGVLVAPVAIPGGAV